MNKKQKDKIIQKWIETNGACDINTKEHNIILYDGGLFAIETEKIKRQKIVGFKPLPNGMQECVFSKKKCVNDVEHKAYLWFCELDETINYLRRMKKMLNKLGYKTNYGK